MKHLTFILLVIVLQGCRFSIYKNLVHNSIREVKVKFSLPKSYECINYYSNFEFYYPRYGAITKLTEEKFLKEFRTKLLLKKEKPLSYDFNTWIKLEIIYNNTKLDSMYLSYNLEGYYYNNRKIGHSGSLNKLLYEKLAEKYKNNEIICVGDSCNQNQIKTCISLLYNTQYSRKIFKELMNKNHNSD